MRLGLVAALLMAATPAYAAGSAGAIFAERPLPDGAVALYGTMGFPGLSLGWRQGFGGTEFGAVAGFSYALTDLTLDLPFRMVLNEGPHHVIGFGVRAGGFADLGARWFEPTNISSAGLRLAGELNFTVRPSDAGDVFFNVETPIELPLTERGNDTYSLRMGGGGELGIGDGYSVGAQLLAGPELLHPRGGQSAARLDISLLVGLGRRF